MVVIDRSREIAGDNVVPHPCIGSARRRVVPGRGLSKSGMTQADVTRQAIENDTPEVLNPGSTGFPSLARAVACAFFELQAGLAWVKCF